MPGLRTQTRTTTPDPLPVTPQQRPVATSGAPMSARSHEVHLQRAQRGLSHLHPVDAPQSGQPAAPASLRAMHGLDGLLDSVESMFGTGTEGLSLRLLGAVPQDKGSERPYLGALVLATALRSAGASTPREAIDLIDQARRGESSPQVFKLQRVLASTAAGAHALAHLQGLQDQPARAQAQRESLQLCSDLEHFGARLERVGSVGQVLASLEARADTRMHAEIGHATDTPTQLLAKALRHAHGQATGAASTSTAGPTDATDAARAADHAAYVAWKQGGFVTSGAGSDFDKAIGRLHKFMTYVDRAEHGPRTPGSLLRDAGASMGRAVGVGKSPLSATRHGTLGAEQGLAHEAAARVRERLDRALGVAVDNLLARWQAPAAQQTTAQRHAHLVRAAVFDLWKDSGSTDHSLSAVKARASALAARTDDPAIAIVDDAALARGLRQFTRRIRLESGEPGVRVGLKALDAVAVAGKPGRGDATAAPGRPQLTELLSELHAARQVGTDAKPLFRLSDLRTLLRGTPREGPTAADARRVMTTVAESPRVGFSQFSDGARGGVGGLGVLALRAAALAGTPIAYPVVGVEAGRAATVSVGQYTTGGRLFIGTENARSGVIGVGGGWVAPPLAPQLASALAVGQVAAGQDHAHTQGLSITSRNDQPGGHDKLAQVIDFLFDQAQPAQGQARPETPSALWHRFAERFGDDPHLGVSWVDERSVTRGVSASATALARVATGLDTGIGPSVTVGVGTSTTRLERDVRGHGGDVPLTQNSRQGGAGLSVGVNQSLPFAAVAGDGAVAGWGAGVPHLGAGLEWRAEGGVGIARLGRDRDGSINASLTQREIVFTEAPALAAYVNRRRGEWEAAMVAQDATGTTRQEDAREHLNRFIGEAAAAHTPRALHGELVSLAPAVAGQINALEAQLHTLQGRGDRAASARTLSANEQRETQALQNEVHRLLRAESSWVPVALYAADTQTQSRSTGLNLGLRATNQEQTSNLRVTALMLATPPQPE